MIKRRNYGLSYYRKTVLINKNNVGEYYLAISGSSTFVGSTIYLGREKMLVVLGFILIRRFIRKMKKQFFLQRIIDKIIWC